MLESEGNVLHGEQQNVLHWKYITNQCVSEYQAIYTSAVCRPHVQIYIVLYKRCEQMCYADKQPERSSISYLQEVKINNITFLEGKVNTKQQNHQSLTRYLFCLA